MNIAREYRERRLITQADAAGMLGIDPSWLSQIEHGRKRPSIKLLHRMAQLYGIKPKSLISLRRDYDDGN